MPDPILEMVSTLPTLPTPPENKTNEMIATLAGLIFPERTRSGTLTGQDRSDLLHIATAIHHRVAGFITGERAILRAREELNQLYSIDVVGAAEFVETLEPGEVGRLPCVPRPMDSPSGLRTYLTKMPLW